MMQKRVINIEQTMNLPCIIYNNIHGVELVEQQKLCNNCGDLHKDYMLRFPYLNFKIYLKQEEFSSFEKSGIDTYTVDTFFDLYQKGFCLYREELCFVLIDHDSEATVLRVYEDEMLEMNYSLDRFKSIQDILDYTIDIFDEDFG